MMRITSTAPISGTAVMVLGNEALPNHAMNEATKDTIGGKDLLTSHDRSDHGTSMATHVVDTNDESDTGRSLDATLSSNITLDPEDFSDTVSDPYAIDLTAASHAQNSPKIAQDSMLLNLPVELLDDIYVEVLVAKAGIEIPSSGKLATPALLQVCHEIKVNASVIYYAKNKFYTECENKLDGAVAWFLRLAMPAREGIKSLTLQQHPENGYGYHTYHEFITSGDDTGGGRGESGEMLASTVLMGSIDCIMRLHALCFLGLHASALRVQAPPLMVVSRLDLSGSFATLSDRTAEYAATNLDRLTQQGWTVAMQKGVEGLQGTEMRLKKEELREILLSLYDTWTAEGMGVELFVQCAEKQKATLAAGSGTGEGAGGSDTGEETAGSGTDAQAAVVER